LLAFLEEGLFYGDMKIFHRYYSHVNKSIIYSVASACEPGYFNLDNIDAYKTRGITLFMKLAFSEQPIEAYEEMLNAAQRMADKLGGELVDERHEMLTPETINRHRMILSNWQERAQA
jgi:cell division protein ZipA